jgi:cyanate permease
MPSRHSARESRKAERPGSHATGFTAAIVSPVIAGLVADRLHSWDLTFVLSIGVMIFGIVLSFFMRPNVPFSKGATLPCSESQRKEDALSGA